MEEIESRASGEKGNPEAPDKSVSKYARKNTFCTIVCKNCHKEAVMHSSKAQFCSVACRIQWTNRHRPSRCHAPEKVVCIVCGNEFKPFSVRSKFCSVKCRAMYNHVKAMAKKTAKNRARIGGDRQCLYCGNTFPPYTGRQVCCSDACYRNWRLGKKLEERARNGEKVETVEDRIRYTSEWHKCPQCGKKFVPISIKQYCCSKECSKAYRAKKAMERTLNSHPIKVCVVCGKEFHARRSDAKCCSMLCSRENGLRRWRESRQRKRDGLPTIDMPLKDQRRVCIVCGTEFTPIRPQQVCCSKECSKKHFIERTTKNRAKRTTGMRSKFQSIEKTCPICGAKFHTTQPKQKYCSVECYQKATEERLKRSSERIEKMREDDRHRKRLIEIDAIYQETAGTIPEFDRVAAMTDGERLEVMKTWDEDKKRRFYELNKKGRRGCILNIRDMSADRRMRIAKKKESEGQSIT